LLTFILDHHQKQLRDDSAILFDLKITVIFVGSQGSMRSANFIQ